MASTVQGWAKVTHRAKARRVTLESWGLAFPQMMAAPSAVTLSFRRSDGEQLYIELIPEDVAKVREVCTEFQQRRKHHETKATECSETGSTGERPRSTPSEADGGEQRQRGEPPADVYDLGARPDASNAG